MNLIQVCNSVPCFTNEVTETLNDEVTSLRSHSQLVIRKSSCFYTCLEDSLLGYAESIQIVLVNNYQVKNIIKYILQWCCWCMFLAESMTANWPLQAIGRENQVLISWCYHGALCICAESLQSCLTLCDPMDCSLPGSSVYRILQAKVLEWGAIVFSVTDTKKLCLCLYIFIYCLYQFP